MGIWTGKLRGKIGNFKFVYVDMLSGECPDRYQEPYSVRQKSTVREVLKRLSLEVTALAEHLSRLHGGRVSQWRCASPGVLLVAATLRLPNGGRLDEAEGAPPDRVECDRPGAQASPPRRRSLPAGTALWVMGGKKNASEGHSRTLSCSTICDMIKRGREHGRRLDAVKKKKKENGLEGGQVTLHLK